MRTVLFVCSGNTCRSPMAEAVARHAIRRGDLDDAGDLLAASAGAFATAGMPPTSEAVRALRAEGIEHAGASKPLTAEMIEKADLVLCMTAAHVDAARALVAEREGQAGKIAPLDPDGDLADPIGRGEDAYHALVRRFLELVPRRLKELLTDENRTRVGSSRG